MTVLRRDRSDTENQNENENDNDNESEIENENETSVSGSISGSMSLSVASSSQHSRAASSTPPKSSSVKITFSCPKCLAKMQVSKGKRTLHSTETRVRHLLWCAMTMEGAETKKYRCGKCRSVVKPSELVRCLQPTLP